jgi:DHA1 family bicyclomycin/chloramphenicol resistance-like MFS transporter
VQSGRQIAGNPTFLRYAGITTILFVPFSSWIASFERIVGEIYGRPELFAWVFAGPGVVLSLSTLLNAHLAARLGARKSLRGLITIYTIIASLLLIFTLFIGDPPTMPLFFILVALQSSLKVAIEPNSSALALER